eukprot:UN31030
MKKVREFFNDNMKNPFYYSSSNVIILSGEEEGYFGWLSTNYWPKNLEPERSTYGAIDMGGASMQITWELDPSSDILENYANLQIFDESYRLYTHSFQGYGLNMSFTSVAQGVGSADHPCLLHPRMNIKYGGITNLINSTERKSKLIV